MLMACSTYEIRGFVFLFKEWVPCVLFQPMSFHSYYSDQSRASVVSYSYLMHNASDNTEPLKRILWNQFGGLCLEVLSLVCATSASSMLMKVRCYNLHETSTSGSQSQSQISGRRDSPELQLAASHDF